MKKTISGLSIDDVTAAHLALIESTTCLASHYNPNQPRAPAGQDDGGEWVAKGGGSGNDEKEIPDVAEGHKRVFHGSPESELDEVKDKGLFGGVFASGEESALSHINTKEGALYYADIPSDKILTQKVLNYDIDYDEQIAALRKAMPRLPSDDLDLAYEVVIEQKDVFGRDNGDVLRIFGGDSIGEASWEGQRIRGRVARELGYQAVEMDDEHGTSYLILPGVKLKRVPGKP